MDRVARIAAPLFFITMVYAGWRFDLNLPIQPLLSPGPWIVALLIATCFSALTVLDSQDKVTPRVLAFWGLIIKLALLPIFLILPLDAGVYCLMLVSSFHGFAATKRLLAEQTIPSATVKRLRKMHAVPIADLVAAIWLYVLLRRLDSAAPASARDA